MSNTPSQKGTVLPTILAQKESEILADWLKNLSAATRRGDLIKDSDLRVQCSQFLSMMRKALELGGTNFQASAWNGVREMLNDISRSRAQQGFSPDGDGDVRVFGEAADLHGDSRVQQRRCGHAGGGNLVGYRVT